MSARPFVVHVAKLRRVARDPLARGQVGLIEDLACSGSEVPPGTEVGRRRDPGSDQRWRLGQRGGDGALVGGVPALPGAGLGNPRPSPVRGLYTEDGDGEDAYRLADDQVDLETLVHDAVLLELPDRPRLPGGMSGLCPMCGVNRNEKACTCESPADDRWAALDVLRVPDLGAGN